MGTYSIEARSMRLIPTGMAAAHDYWILKDDQGNILAELHGLATDRDSGEALEIGTTDRHSLQVYELIRNSTYAAEVGSTLSKFYYNDDSQAKETVFTGSKEDVMARWKTAVNAIPVLNALDLDYPAYGFKTFSPTVNSNATYTTMGEIMGIKPVDFPLVIEPGFDYRMAPSSTIDALKYKPTTSSVNSWDVIFGKINDPASFVNSLIDINTTTTLSALGGHGSAPIYSINDDSVSLFSNNNYSFRSNLGDVNTASGLYAFSNYIVSNNFRPGNFNIYDPSPTSAINFSAGSFLSGLSYDYDVTGARFNSSLSDVISLSPTDPLVLDLNNDGVRLTSFGDAAVLFDIDNDGGSKELTGWVSAQDGIVVHDLNHNEYIDNISEMLSEFYNGVVGSNGQPGTKLPANGFAALKSLDTSDVGGLNIFNSSDAAFADLKVWIDANHDGKSWIDANNNGVKDNGEISELKSFAELGITEISLSSQAQSGEVRDGNEVLARGTFKRNGNTYEAIAANFLSNPVGSTFTTSNGGVTARQEGTGFKSYVSTNTNALLNESLDATLLSAINLTGGAGADTLTGDTANNLLAGGLGADILKGGAGNDILLADANDLKNASNIDGGSGLDMIQIVGNEGATIDMAKSNLEIAVGGRGNDVIIGGGGSTVFVRGGEGNDFIVGSSANDALNGEEGDDYINGGAGNDVLRGHQGQDQLIGGAGNDVLDGGLEDDRLFAGDGDDVLLGASGDDFIDGGAGIDLVEYSGNFSNYRVTQLDSATWRVVDLRGGKDGSDTLVDVEKLSFANLSHVDLHENAAAPVEDVLTKDAAQNALSRNGSYYIGKKQLLANDFNLKGENLYITAVSGAKGGEAKLITDQANAHYGDVLFTPKPSFTGVMSFTYQIETESHFVMHAVNPGTDAIEPMRATAYLRTADLPTDPLMVEQWYLTDSQVIPVWADYTGKGVHIGQFEPESPYATGPEVFDYRHSDLQANVDRAWLSNQTGALPPPINNHATMVAGVMVAARNGEGAVGVAYDAQLTGYSMKHASTYEELNAGIVADVAQFEKFDIVNNSWSMTASFSLQANPPGLLIDGIARASTFGRHGLGTAMVMAAGNWRQSGANTNTNTLTANHAVIVVGAINAPDGLGDLYLGHAPFSSPGASILVSAAGSNIRATSRELQNDNGSVFGEDTATTQGTSFATPIVSGVIALMLEANPNLGYRDIQTILAMSAVKFNDPNGTDWTYNKAKNWNGGGMHASHDYGFGKVDARAAVRLAETWYDLNHAGNLAVQSAASSSALNAVLQDGSGVYTSTLTAADGVNLA